jgi:hypothetical protein
LMIYNNQTRCLEINLGPRQAPFGQVLSVP